MAGGFKNKELKNFRRNFVDVTDKELKEANDYFSRKYTFMGDELAQHINTLLKVTSNSIPVQKVKDMQKEKEWALQSYDCTKADYKQSQAIGAWDVLRKLLEGRE